MLVSPSPAGFAKETQPAGGFLVLFVVGKELWLRDAVIRLAITFLAFLAAAWFFSFVVSAMHEPLVGILRQIG